VRDASHVRRRAVARRFLEPFTEPCRERHPKRIG